MKTRVAIVLPYFGKGGAESMVSRLASHLDLSLVDVEVICIYGTALNNCLEQAVAKHGVPIKFIGKGKGFSIGAVFRLWKELSRFKPDVIHTHLSACVYCAPWVLTHKVKMLHTIHSVPKFELIKPKKKVMAVMYRLHKSIPIAISNEIGVLMLQEYGRNTPFELIYNPVDIKRFDIEKKAHSGINIITVGRLSKEKNQKLLIDSVKRLIACYPDLKLTMLGDGPCRDDLENYVKQNNMQDIVAIKGHVDNAEDYYSKADIFALTSIYEGLPLVLLEAMAAGLPIVATDVGGVKDVVTDNGILVESGKIDAVADALKKLILESDLRKEMGLLSRKNVQKYDSTDVAYEYIKLYEKYSNKL